jgi:hypothetical protein
MSFDRQPHYRNETPLTDHSAATARIASLQAKLEAAERENAALLVAKDGAMAAKVHYESLWSVAKAGHEQMYEAAIAANARAEAAEQQVQEMREDLAPLQDFVNAVFGEFPEHGDIDGFALQDIAESCGLLRAEMVTAPCGEVCGCADAGANGPTECYRIQPVLSRARDASAERRVAIDAARKGEAA